MYDGTNIPGFLLFVLYLIAIISINIKNIEKIGFSLLLLAIAVGIGFHFVQFYGIVQQFNYNINFIPGMIMASIMISEILTLISVIFISIVLTYKDFPPIYKDKLEEYKRIIIATFVICFVLMLCFIFNLNSLNFNFTGTIKNVESIKNNWVSILTLALTVVPVILSSLQLSTANSFLIITRQPK